MSKRLPVEVDEGLWDLVARGIATADAFSAVRSLLDAPCAGRGGTSPSRTACSSQSRSVRRTSDSGVAADGVDDPRRSGSSSGRGVSLAQATSPDRHSSSSQAGS